MKRYIDIPTSQFVHLEKSFAITHSLDWSCEFVVLILILRRYLSGKINPVGRRKSQLYRGLYHQPPATTFHTYHRLFFQVSRLFSMSKQELREVAKLNSGVSYEESLEAIQMNPCIYERIGKEEGIRKLSELFYDRVFEDKEVWFLNIFSSRCYG